MNLRNKQKKEAKRKKEMLEASTGIVKAEKRTRCKMNQLCIPGKTNGLSMHIHILGRNKGRQSHWKYAYADESSPAVSEHEERKGTNYNMKPSHTHLNNPMDYVRKFHSKELTGKPER